MIQVLGNSLIWISLYYFTFELLIIKSTLEAQSSKELNQIKRKIIVFKVVTFSILILNAILLSVLMMQSIPNFFYLGETLSVTIDSINTGVKITIDFIMYWQFIILFMYFIKIRKERSNNVAIKFTFFNIFIICWTIFLWLLCVYQSISTI